MFNKLFRELQNRSSLLIYANIALSLVRLLYTSWCNASGKYFGFYYSSRQWHSCSSEFPGALVLTWVTIAVMALSAYALIHDYGRFQDHTANFKSVNVSRLAYYLSLLLINFQIESITTSAKALRITDGPEGLAFNTFIFAFPVALLIYSAATYSIVKKTEWVISWK
jgi:hypothetical protein